MEENKIYCSHCGALIEDDDYSEINGEIICTDCVERYTVSCERCGAIIWDSDSYAALAVMLYFMRMMPIILMAMITVLTVIMKRLIATEVSTNMVTSQSLYSMASMTDILALNLKSMEQAKTMITQMKYSVSLTVMKSIFTSNLMAHLTMVWNLYHIQCLWIITRTTVGGR